MAHQIHAEIVASITEFKRNPLGVVAAGDGFPVAVLNRNRLCCTNRLRGFIY